MRSDDKFEAGPVQATIRELLSRPAMVYPEGVDITEDVREDLKLNRPDVGWYQIRNALKRREEGREQMKADFAVFEAAYKTLTEKLVPQVYELGFLR